MHARKSLFHPVSFVIAAVCFAALSAQAAESAFPTSSDSAPSTSTTTMAEPSKTVGPSANNDAFRKLRTQCEKDVPAGKANGDICVEAAALLVGNDIPDEYRDMNEDLRIKFALRLLERGVDSSNRARGSAYDWYDKTGFLGISSYADAFRARELMDMMESSGYPGGALRKIRGATSILSFTASEADKRAGCATAKKLLGEGKLDADSLNIAKVVVASGVCTGYEPIKQ